jgi:type VI secretion system protein ImpJ
MSWNSNVVWSEGMLVRPQHFQQQARFLDRLVDERVGALSSHPWGLEELEIDREALSLGKLAIQRLKGTLPDGTPLNIPDDDAAPPTLEVPEGSQNRIVYLTLPLKRRGAAEVDAKPSDTSLARFTPVAYEARDSNEGMEGKAVLQVGRPRLKLLLEGEDLGAYATLGLTRIVECAADRKVRLDDAFVPPSVRCSASPRLAGLIKEISGMLRQRSDSLAGRVSESGRGGSAEVADFMFLLVVNRYAPLFAHFGDGSGIHPETLFQVAVSMAGELSAFSANRRAPEFPPYRHDHLAETFAPVMDALRRSLSAVLERAATALPLEPQKYGIYLATVADRSLIKGATFVLSVKADLAAEEIAGRFPAQVKIGSSDTIRDLVNLQLPGIRLRALPVAPRQIPYHSGATYFELDRGDEQWTKLAASGVMALHVGGDFPGLGMELWAIRS